MTYEIKHREWYSHLKDEHFEFVPFTDAYAVTMRLVAHTQMYSIGTKIYLND